MRESTASLWANTSSRSTSKSRAPGRPVETERARIHAGGKDHDLIDRRFADGVQQAVVEEARANGEKRVGPVEGAHAGCRPHRIENVEAGLAGQFPRKRIAVER